MTVGSTQGPATGAPEFSIVRGIVDRAVAEEIVPGAVLLCACDGVVRFLEAFGARQLEPERLCAEVNTVYDIASLTKAVSTSVLAMIAVAAEQLTLDDRVQRYLPEFRGDSKELVTVRHLLCHASGLPAHRPFYANVLAAGVPSASAIARAAAEEPLINRPGATSVYSDLGFIVLGWVLERVTATNLDDLFRKQLSEPLGLSSTVFLNAALSGESRREGFMSRHEVAPTESCARRGRVVRGEVHDLNAAAMGGVAGHAGLFSDASDLGRIAAALVSAWQGSDDARAIVPRDVVREFWRPAGIAGSTWRLGWDGPSVHDSQAGEKLSRAAVGHLGFTGCSIWIDPERALWIVLLTNRVHPIVRDDPRFRRLRADVHDAAVDALLRDRPGSGTRVSA